MTQGEATLDPRTPVVVAVGQVEQRTSDLDQALEPTALLAEAARAAQADSGADRLLASVDTMAVIHILSHHYLDPAALLAADLGVAPARTIHTDDGGNYPQSLLNRACAEIQAGSSQTWLIGGAETWRTRQAARAQGVDLGWSKQGDDVAPTEHVTNHLPLSHEGEWARGVVLPASIYALFENQWRAAQGWSLDEHRDRLAALYAGFSAVAVTNPHAWIRTPWTADEIREPSPRNRMVGFPYTKVMNANNAVEQAACFVVTSVEHARSLGISSDRWVFPWSGSDAHEHWFVSNRWSLGAAPAIGIAGRGALDLAGVGPDDLGHIDVYSCFPSAVQIAAAELGLGTDRSLTVTGGLSFGGGPWNNYVSHSIAAMVERLRGDAGSLGLVTGNGGFLTKHAFGVYSTTPPPRPWRHVRPQDEVDARPSREFATVVDDAVTVESTVVMHDRDSQPDAAIVSGLLADGRRAWGNTSDAVAMKQMITSETAGAAGRIDADGAFTFT
ncbi:acetyl-CoA acetyltransferase [Aquihabitans sp. McL0605]|uniref:acetyl-CoA acetyltransferase n=1 Tax=Aquihabitans sp. McL0605 TaxID=3415671 RepID=UPI003CE73E59